MFDEEVVNTDDMVLDMDAFDFNSIVDDNGKEPAPEYNEEEYEEGEEGEEFEDEEGDDIDVEDDLEDTTSITEALGQLGAIADDFELDFGSTKVQKGELVKLLNDRDTITKTRDAIDGFAGRLVEKENILNVSFEVAKTETDKQLEHVYAMLNDPTKWNSSVDVAALQKNRIALENRKAELETKRTEATAAIAEQKQQAAIFNIQKVVQEMGGNGPLNEAAKYAESKGISLEHVIQGLSPAMVTAFQNAAKYEALVAKNKGKLEAVASARKPRSKPVGSKTAPKVTQSARDKAWAAHRAGKIDAADMFNFLVD